MVMVVRERGARDRANARANRGVADGVVLRRGGGRLRPARYGRQSKRKRGDDVNGFHDVTPGPKIECSDSGDLMRFASAACDSGHGITSHYTVSTILPI